MLAQYAETETVASRVLYINSKDATQVFNANSSDFDFTLEEPIVVPEHHTILMSIFSAEIPYSFYNFQIGVNCRLDYAVTPFGVVADYDANGFLDLTPVPAASLIIPEGNYNAVELAALLTSSIPELEVTYDSVAIKFRFRCTTILSRVTLGIRYGASIPVDNSMNEELGWDLQGLIGDCWVQLNGAGTQWWYGFSQPAGVGPGADISSSGPFFIAPNYFLFADDVCDMTNSIRSLFIRTNLSSTSVLDSHIGGGFSNILTRVPINAEPGGVINIRPSDGHIHKLLIKQKAITSVSIRLTNQKNVTINLNGLNFDISLKLEFIETKLLHTPPSGREIVEKSRLEAQHKAQEKLKLSKKGKSKKKDKPIV